jgi:hypothetical protein
MRKLLVISLGLAMLFACKKNGNNQKSSYLFSFQVGDSTYTFDSTSTIIDTVGGNYITTINAFNTKTNSFVIIHMQSNTTSEKGSYTPSTPQTPYNLINIFITILSDVASTNYIIGDGPFVFIINQASNNNIKGSFSGMIYNVDTRGNSALSNGQFNIPVQYR